MTGASSTAVDRIDGSEQPIAKLAVSCVLLMAGASVALAEVLRQDVTYDQGIPLLISVGELVTIGLSPVEWDGIGRRRFAFQLLVANNSNRAFDADPARIVVASDGAPVELVSASELAKEVRRRGGWNRFALAVAGGLNASTAGSQAGQYTEQGTFRGNVIGSGGSSSVQGRYSAEGYDGAAANAASQRQLDQTQALLHGSKQADQSRIQELQNEVLLRTTIQPNAHIVRTVVLEPSRQVRDGAGITFTVDLGGERHVLQFYQRSDQWEPQAQNLRRQPTHAPVDRASTPVVATSAASAAPPIESPPAAPTPSLPGSSGANPTASAVRANPISSPLASTAPSGQAYAPVTTARPADQALAQILVDESMYLSHLSWAGGQVAMHLGNKVKASRRLQRAHNSNPDLLREGLAAAFAPFITHQDMQDAVLAALREHVPMGQIRSVLSMSPEDRNAWYALLCLRREYQAHMLNNLRIPSSPQVAASLSTELHSRFPQYRFAETWESD